MAGNAAHGISVSVIAPAAYLRDFAAQDPATVPDTLAALEEAGVTWVLEAFPPGAPPDRVTTVVGQGPP